MKSRRLGTALVMLGGLTLLLMTGACGALPDNGQAADSAQQVNATWKTRWGPLSAADRDLIHKVRLASLWEMPSAQQAQQRARSPRVRQISAEIADQHMALDQQVRDIALKLDVDLPVQPTAQQKQWMKDMSGRTGRDYDVTYVKWLRLAHGQVFALIGSVRGSTQNTLVRTFAEAANKAVLNHQRLLESTGLTTSNSYPEPPTVAPAPSPGR